MPKQAAKQNREEIEEWHPHKKGEPFKERDARKSGIYQEFGENVVHRYEVDLVIQVRNRCEGLAREKPQGPIFPAIYSLDKYVHIAVVGLDSSNKFLVRI